MRTQVAVLLMVCGLAGFALTTIASPSTTKGKKITNSILDCNNNGIDDLEDVRSGVGRDNDHNGLLDGCNWAVDWDWSRRHGLLGPNALTPLDAHLMVRYSSGREITLIYAVDTTEKVALFVAKEPGRSETIYEGQRSRGVYEIKYVPKTSSNDVKLSGLEVVRISLGPTIFVQPIAWIWN